jgi:hypothetical protein
VFHVLSVGVGVRVRVVIHECSDSEDEKVLLSSTGKRELASKADWKSVKHILYC